MKRTRLSSSCTPTAFAVSAFITSVTEVSLSTFTDSVPVRPPAENDQSPFGVVSSFAAS